MKWNPFINAITAFLYIGTIITLLRFVEKVRGNTPDTFIDGMAAISLFTTSAVVMGFLFFYQPLVLIINKETRAALTFFLKTIGVFSIITALLLTFALIQ